MNEITMTKQEAKAFMVQYHMINIKQQPSGKEGILEIFDRIQVIQYDPLNMVGRNSDLVLQSRMKNYARSMLDEALYQDRTLIDAWDKQMCIYQTKDFPYFKETRRLRGEEAVETLKYRLSIEALEYIDEVISYIKDNGPTYSSALKIGETKTHKWGHTKPSSATLDYLFHIGRLGVYSKNNTQKQYDLIENLIDQKYLEDSPIHTDEEFIEWYLLRRIASMGLVSLKNGIMWSGHRIQDKQTREQYIKKLVQEGLVTKVHVEGLNEDLYGLTESLLHQEPVQNTMSFIAPLDNLIWDRKLIKALFDFDYTWEVYTPLSKRKYGYYVLPILYGCDFVGRLEFDMHRNDDALYVKNIWWEDGVSYNKQLQNSLDRAIKQFHRYLLRT